MAGGPSAAWLVARGDEWAQPVAVVRPRPRTRTRVAANEVEAVCMGAVYIWRSGDSPSTSTSARVRDARRFGSVPNVGLRSDSTGSYCIETSKYVFCT